MSLVTPEKIRTLQRKLYRKAKAEPAFRFYVLYDKICREDILRHAYGLARGNAGAPGVDGMSFGQIEAAGLEAWLAALREELVSKTYRPDPVHDYRSLLLVPGESLGKERLLLPVPFALWKIIGTIGELLPARPITRSQVELMDCDNIASPGVPGFANLRMAPRSLEEILPQINPGHGRGPEPAAP